MDERLEEQLQKNMEALRDSVRDIPEDVITLRREPTKEETRFVDRTRSLQREVVRLTDATMRIAERKQRNGIK